jgi:hypothetical protein
VDVETPKPGEVYEGFTIFCEFGMGFGGGGGSTWTIIADKDGDHVWWFQGSGGGDCVRSRMSYDGQYMWIANGNVPGPSSGTLTRVRMDGTGEESYDVPYRNHDIAIMPDDKVAYFEYKDGNSQNCDVVKELDPNTRDITTIYDATNANPSQAASCHANAINYWPDEDLFTLSILNWDAIIAFTRAGSLVWTIGGSTSDYQGASWNAQHNHHLLGSNIVIFNNQGTNGSNVLEYAMSGSQAQLVFDYASGNSTQSMGDVKRLPNGNTLVTYSNSGVMQEVNADKELVQEITTNGVGYTVRRKTLYGPPPPYQD